ncbi:MAG: glycoside hydrolase family 13 protein [Actinobacteria bacterium]|nr:glycoside hydrolase family 13 protein [Actinomycetota bacterium]
MPEPHIVAADPAWWRTAVVYQVYPRSFADSDGDGIGDLAGVRSRLGYLADLGVDAIWLSPFYPSPLADGGYDITDHRAVDPRLGTLDDFVALTKEAHAHRLKVIIDVVPNHTSDQHPWFREALAAGPGSPERDRYIFRVGAGPDGAEPPADWASHFGGPAWERVPDGQWYCHLFAREQPDLNWDNPEIRQYFLDTLRFWADLDVDGFRVDVAHSLAKDLSSPLRSQPDLDRNLPLDGSDPLYDREEVHEIYRSWRAVFDSYDPPKMAVAETWHPTTSRTYLYARPSELGQVFDFSLLKAEWGRDAFQDVIRRSLEDHQGVGGGLTWVLSSHDVPRHPSRYALPAGVTPDAWLSSHGTRPVLDPGTARRRGRAATLMMLALPGSAYLYQGEELGLLEVADLTEDQLRDPVWERSGRTLKGRDGCRVPLPWTRSGPSFGFGPAGAWLPQPAWFADYSVESEADDPESSLTLYRQALMLRRALNADDTGVDWLDTDDPQVLHFGRRNGWQVVVNFSADPRPLPEGRVILSSGPLDGHLLPGETTLWTVRR